MKNLLAIMCLIGLSLLTNSCDNDLNLIAEDKDIPVVYGLINRNDTVHYLRVEKVFVDSEIAPAELAQDPNNLYYDNIQVQIKNKTTEETYSLTKVNGDTEGYPREEGAFVQSPNYLYKLKLPDGKQIGGGHNLELVLTRGEEAELVTANIKVVSDLAVTPIVTQTQFSINMVSKFSVRSRYNVEDTYIFDFYAVLHYREKPITGTEWELKSLLWNLARDIEPEAGKTQVSISIPKDAFLTYMASHIEADPNVIRVFETVDLRVDAGGLAIKESIDLGKVNSGLTSSQVTPISSNISGGLGVFSSRNSSTNPGFILTPASKDSLRLSSQTAPLQFQ